MVITTEVKIVARKDGPCLWKNGNYYGKVTADQGKEIVAEQKGKGCKIFTGEGQIAIMSPGWKPRPPVVRCYSPDPIRSMEEFE